MNNIRRLLHRLSAGTRRRAFDATRYWEERYRRGETSGGGSYGERAEWKAAVLNQFVHEHGIQSVIEFGCGDGNQLSLASYPEYTGLDISAGAIELCLERFGDDSTKSFFLYSPRHFRDSRRILAAELSVSLEVIFHITNDEDYRLYLEHLFGESLRYVIIFSTNHEDKRPVDAAGEPITHVRHRAVLDDVKALFDDFEHALTIPADSRTGVASSFYVFERKSRRTEPS